MCIARFCNAFAGQIGRRNVRGELCGDALKKTLAAAAAHSRAVGFFDTVSVPEGEKLDKKLSARAKGKARAALC